MGAFCHGILHTDQANLVPTIDHPELTKYISYYHKYILKCVFVIVVVFKSQSPVWVLKYSFRVKQRRDVRLNIYFETYLGRYLKCQRAIWEIFLIFSAKHKSLTMTI